MRTTIEICDEDRAWLLEMAARRGEKGYSRIVQDALKAYRESLKEKEERRRAILALQGSITEEQAEHLHRHVGELREAPWR